MNKCSTQVMEYEYEPEMEEAYRGSLFKTFKKTVEDGFFPFIIVDAINDRVKYFEEMWSFAKQKGFQVTSILSFSLLFMRLMTATRILICVLTLFSRGVHCRDGHGWSSLSQAEHPWTNFG